jgi:hypothetical protein
MQSTQFIIPRLSNDESTFAVVTVDLMEQAIDAGLSGATTFLAALKDTVTEWVKTTDSGRKAWEESDENFNVGDLANENLEALNELFMERHAAFITDIDVFSQDGNTGDEWAFDDVLVDSAKL